MTTLEPKKLLKDIEERNKSLEQFTNEQKKNISKNIETLTLWIEKNIIDNSHLSELKSSKNSNTDIEVTCQKNKHNCNFYIEINYYDEDVFDIPKHPMIELQHIYSKGSRYIDDASTILTLIYTINLLGEQ